jgi:predicted phage tail protein
VSIPLSLDRCQGGVAPRSYFFGKDHQQLWRHIMTDTHTHHAHTSAEKTFPFLLDTGELAALGKKRMGALMRVQTEFLDELQETNRHWLDSIQSEADLASEFASKLSSARSMPDAMAVSRDWATQYFAMLAEDGKHLADDTRKFIERGARIFSDGFSAQQPAANS